MKVDGMDPDDDVSWTKVPTGFALEFVRHPLDLNTPSMGEIPKCTSNMAVGVAVGQNPDP